MAQRSPGATLRPRTGPVSALVSGKLVKRPRVGDPAVAPYVTVKAMADKPPVARLGEEVDGYLLVPELKHSVTLIDLAGATMPVTLPYGAVADGAVRIHVTRPTGGKFSLLINGKNHCIATDGGDVEAARALCTLRRSEDGTALFDFDAGRHAAGAAEEQVDAKAHAGRARELTTAYACYPMTQYTGSGTNRFVRMRVHVPPRQVVCGYKCHFIGNLIVVLGASNVVQGDDVSLLATRSVCAGDDTDLYAASSFSCGESAKRVHPIVYPPGRSNELLLRLREVCAKHAASKPVAGAAPVGTCAICMENRINLKYDACPHCICSSCMSERIARLGKDERLVCHECRATVGDVVHIVI